MSGRGVLGGALSILQIGSFCHLQPLSPELLLPIFGTPLFEGPRGLQVKGPANALPQSTDFSKQAHHVFFIFKFKSDFSKQAHHVAKLV